MQHHPSIPDLIQRLGAIDRDLHQLCDRDPDRARLRGEEIRVLVRRRAILRRLIARRARAQVLRPYVPQDLWL